MPRLRWVIAGALSLLLSFMAGTVYVLEFQKIGRLEATLAERSAKLLEKERSVRNYRDKIEFYKTQEGIAHLAREQYNLGFAGERVFVILGASPDIARYP